MKKSFSLPVVCLMSVFLFSSCIKDTLTKTYTIYRPVYKSKAEVTANIKTNAPKEISKAGKFFLYGKYLFVNEIDKGIHVIDNSNPAIPKKIGFIDIPGNVDMAVKSNILYADLYTDMVAIDISDPLNATLKKVIKNAFPQRRYLGAAGFVSDTTRVIVDWIRKDTVVDESAIRNEKNFCFNCNVMQFASADRAAAIAPAAIAGSMARFAIAKSYLYTVNDWQLKVFSVSVPSEPVYTKEVMIGWGIETIFPFKQNLFIGSNTGMFIFDISDASTPKKVSQFNHATVCDPVIADDNYAFVTLRTGETCRRGNINQLDILNVTDVKTPSLIKSYQLTNPHGLSKDGNLLFICDGRDGFKVFDATDVLNLKLLRHFTGFETYDVIAYNNIAMVVEKSGIRQFDYSNPANIRYLSTINW